MTLAGAVVLAPVPAFYHRLRTIDGMLRHTADRILDQFGVSHDLFPRWAGASRPDSWKSTVREGGQRCR